MYGSAPAPAPSARPLTAASAPALAAAGASPAEVSSRAVRSRSVSVRRSRAEGPAIEAAAPSWVGSSGAPVSRRESRSATCGWEGGGRRLGESEGG